MRKESDKGLYPYGSAVAQVMTDGDLELMLDMISIAYSRENMCDILLSETHIEDERFATLYRKVEACLGLGQNRPGALDDADANMTTTHWIWCSNCSVDVARFDDGLPQAGKLYACDRCGRVYMIGRADAVTTYDGEEVWE